MIPVQDPQHLRGVNVANRRRSSCGMIGKLSCNSQLPFMPLRLLGELKSARLHFRHGGEAVVRRSLMPKGVEHRTKTQKTVHAFNWSLSDILWPEITHEADTLVGEHAGAAIGHETTRGVFGVG